MTRSTDFDPQYTQGRAAAPQLKIGAFVHMQSNGVADGTEDWETMVHWPKTAHCALKRRVPWSSTWLTGNGTNTHYNINLYSFFIVLLYAFIGA